MDQYGYSGGSGPAYEEDNGGNDDGLPGLERRRSSSTNEGDAAAAAGLASGGKPLKRGSACLFCRKRKLRCTGTKPCPVCIKHGQTCTFDEARSSGKSRVSQLEEKIAGLERILTAQTGGAPLGRGGNTQSGGGQPSHLQQQPQHPAQRDRTSSYPYPPRKQASTSSPEPAATQVDQQQIDFSLALQELFQSDPNGLGQDVSFASYLRPHEELPRQQENPNAPGYFAAYGRYAPLSSAGLVDSQPLAQSHDPAAPAVDPSFWDLAGSPLANPNLFGDNMFGSPPVTVNDAPMSNFGPLVDALGPGLPEYNLADLAQSFGPAATVPAWSPGETFGGSSRGTAGADLDVWGDGTVLPEGMRDHLLKLFFERRRQFALISSIPRFLASLDGPPHLRPPPGLIFAMYACVAHFSPNPHIRELESTFFDLARRKIESGVELYNDQRYIHLIQASTILSVLCYSKARYDDGWVLGGTAVRLAQSCRLHRISSKEIEYDLQCFADGIPVRPNHRSGMAVQGGAPKDGIELGERIWAFYGAVLLDQLGAIATGRSPGLAFTETETPLPRPLDEYERGTIDISQSRNVYALLTDTTPRPASNPLGGVLLESVMLLAATLSLGDHFIQPSLREHHFAQPFVPGNRTPATSRVSSPGSAAASPYDSTASAPSSTTAASTSSGASVSSASVSKPALPEEWQQMERALLRFVEQLPQKYRDPSRPWVGGIPPWHVDQGVPSDQGTFDGPSSVNTKIGGQPVVFSLHVTLCTAFLLLYTEAARFDPSTYRPKAMQAASSAVQLIQLVKDIDFGQLDIFLIVFWRIQARTILEEIKLLRAEGKDERAAGLLVDVDVLVLAMRRMGQLWSYGNDLAEKVERTEEGEE